MFANHICCQIASNNSHKEIQAVQGSKQEKAPRPAVIDFDDVSLHFIECINIHLQNIRMKGFVPNALQMNPVTTAPFANGTNGYQAPAFNQGDHVFWAHSGMDGSGNDLHKTLLGIFREPSILACEHGLHIDEVFRRLGLPKNKIQDAINYLVDVGHIYSTIDEYHFKSASNGCQ